MSFSVTGPTLGLTISQWCDNLIEEYLDREAREQLDALKSAVTTGDTVILTTHGASGVRDGNRLEIDGELIHIWETFEQRSTVRRGVAGSTATDHSADTLVRINPRFPKITLANQLRREIRSWPSALIAVTTATFEIDSDTETVDLDGLANFDGLRLLRVQREHPRTGDTSWPDIDASIDTRQDTDEFASGKVLRIVSRIGTGTDLRIAVGYRFPVPEDALDLTVDIGETFHINERLADAAMMGVAARMVMTEEVPRTNDRSQQRPRRAEDVAPGHRLQAGQQLMAERERLLSRELERLYNEYPPRHNL